MTDATANGGSASPAGEPVPARRRSRPPAVLLIAGALVALVIVIPLVFLIVEAVQDGWSALYPLLFRQLTGTLLWNTVSLTVVVTVLCAMIGTLAAWFVERT